MSRGASGGERVVRLTFIPAILISVIAFDRIVVAAAKCSNECLVVMHSTALFPVTNVGTAEPSKEFFRSTHASSDF